MILPGGDAMTDYDFPFGIMEVADQLPLKKRKPGPQSYYYDCPFCGRTGKLNLNYAKNVWRCNYCGESGGMLELYARMYGITTSDAFYELKEILGCGTGTTRAAPREVFRASPPLPMQAASPKEGIPQSPRADAKVIHHTYSVLLDMLHLSAGHQTHLTSPKRGLSQEQIRQLRYKSTPLPFLCRSITDRLIKQGCKVQGVPGFYLDSAGRWTLNFSKRTAGILIPARSIDGLICGMQILLDVPIREKDAPPDKTGAKYIWLSSASKPMGTTSGSPVHFAGSPANTIYITEGLLKGDIAHLLADRTFLSVAGANNLGGIERLLPILAATGTTQLIEAFDMDKYSNKHVRKGADRLFQLAGQYGLKFDRLKWNPNYKGVDDWLIAKRGLSPRQGENVVKLNQTQEYHFRIYQLDLTRVVPFAFQDIAALHKAGYTQPPAAMYQLVWDGTYRSPSGISSEKLLDRILSTYQSGLPSDYQGRAVAPSDIIELYGKAHRRYYYCNKSGFTPVTFSPFLCRSTHAHRPAA